MGFVSNLPSDYFAMGIQTAKGTEASTFIFVKHLDGTGMELDQDVTSEREGGDGQEVGYRYKTMIKMDGQVNANARGEVTALGAAGALGKTAARFDSASAPGGALATGMQVHRFVGNATLPYLTAEQRFSDNIERVSDCKLSGLDIEGEAGKPIKISFPFIAGGTPYWRDTASALTPTRDSSDPAHFPRGSYAISGVGTAKLTKFKVSVKRGNDDGIQTTELFREDVLEQTTDYDLDFTLKYEDRTLYQAVLAGGGSVVPLALATGAFMAYSANPAPRTATTFRSITANFACIDYVGAKVNKLDPDGKTVYIDVSAMTRKGATDSLVLDVALPSRAALV